MNLIQLNEENLNLLLDFYIKKNDGRDNSIISRLNNFKDDLKNNNKSLTLMDAFSSNDVFFKNSFIQKNIVKLFNNDKQNIAYDYENHLHNHYKNFKSCKRSILMAYTYSLKNNFYYPLNDDCINDFACKSMIFNKSDLSTTINLILQNKDPNKLINGMDQLFSINSNLTKFKQFSINEQKSVLKTIKNQSTLINNPKTNSLLEKLDVKIDTLQFMKSNSFGNHSIELNLLLLEHNSELSKSQIRTSFVFLGNQFKKTLIQYKENNKKNFLSIMNLSQDTIGADLLIFNFHFNNFDKKDDIKKLADHIVYESINLLLQDSFKFKEITMNEDSCFQYIQSLIYYNDLKDVIPQKNISNANKKNKI